MSIGTDGNLFITKCTGIGFWSPFKHKVQLLLTTCFCINSSASTVLVISGYSTCQSLSS